MYNRSFIENFLLLNLSELGNKVQYLRYDPSTTKNKYGESKRKNYLPPVELDAIIRYDPTKEEIEEFGMDKDNIEIVVKVLNTQLESAGITPSTDDAIRIGTETYFITSTQSKGILQNKPILIRIGCKKRSENRAE